MRCPSSFTRTACRALTLDYNDFVVGGEMSKLEVKDGKSCDK